VGVGMPLQAHFKMSVPIQMAAVATIADHYPGSTGPALLVSTFGVKLAGGLPSFAIPNLPGLLAGNASSKQQIESSEKWTNYIGMAPSALGPGLVVTAGGFLIPVGGISTGRVCIFDVSGDPAKPIETQVSTDKKGWFYHKVVWYDMNQDGRLDLVTARATAPSNPAGELVWFNQPAEGAFSNASFTASPWEVHVVTSGPDVDFIMEDIDGDGLSDIVAAQFFSAPVLAMYSCPEQSWSLCNETNVVKKVIDDVSGPFFSVEAVDLNLDGKMDLLVTNNQDDKGADGKGSVFGFERPSGSSKWTKHVLATGFTPHPSALPSPGAHSKGAPGKAASFHAKLPGAGKPQVLLSGDDGGFVSVLSPVSQDSADWNYSQSMVCNSTGTIGSPAVGDVDGDGMADIFIPFYSDNKVEVYSFMEGPTPQPSAQCTACLLKKDPVKLSPAYTWCYKDGACHIVGSPVNPCSATQCASAARTSTCSCTSCNDGACHT